MKKSQQKTTFIEKYIDIGDFQAALFSARFFCVFNYPFLYLLGCLQEQMDDLFKCPLTVSVLWPLVQLI